MKEIKDLKMKKTADLAKLSAEKLTVEIKESEKTLYTMKIKMAVGELKQTHLVKAMRRYIASMKTLLVNAK